MASPITDFDTADLVSEFVGKANALIDKRASLDYRTVTTTDTALTTDQIVYLDATAGAFTFTLYTVTGNEGLTLRLVKADSSGNAITVDGAGSEPVSVKGAWAATNYSLATQGDAITIVATSTRWIVVARVS